MTTPAIAILDDYQNVALGAADWRGLEARARIAVFHEPWPSEDALVAALAPFDILVLMRERTPFPASVIARLPNLRLIALTGARTNTLDVAACTARGIPVTHTTINPSTGAAELAFALILACARGLPRAFTNMASGRWEEDVRMGMPLVGKRLGILGLGQLGGEVARFGLAFKMDVVAWSDDMTPAAAAAHNVRMVDKAELFATSDIITLHLVLSKPRSWHTVGRAELMSMKRGAILINAARAGLVDTDALMDVLTEGRIMAGLDVYDIEPLPPDHPLRKMPNVVLTPHLGYVVDDVFTYYYRDIVEDIEAWLDGRPIRILDPEALRNAPP
jgi:phosphoglycerate dehydrogenase-like enzyme